MSRLLINYISWQGLQFPKRIMQEEPILKKLAVTDIQLKNQGRIIRDWMCRQKQGHPSH